MSKKRLCVALSLFAIGNFSTTARATPDVLAVNFDSLSMSSTAIDFFTSTGPNGFNVGSSSTGAYSSLGGTTGTIRNVMGVSIANFLTIPSLPNAQFTLTAVNPGVFSPASCSAAPAVGQSCSAIGSPFNLMNTPTGSVVSFSAVGTVLNTTTGVLSTFTATFSTEFTGQSFQSVLSQVGQRRPDQRSLLSKYQCAVRELCRHAKCWPTFDLGNDGQCKLLAHPSSNRPNRHGRLCRVKRYYRDDPEPDRRFWIGSTLPCNYRSPRD